MNASGDTPKTREQLGLQSAESAAFRRMLAASQGTFSFSIAICNGPALRDYLISKLRQESPSIEVIEINNRVTDILDFARTSVTATNNTGIFITGIEKILPSDQKDFKVLRVLNATRESWRSTFSCPVVFWLAEYAATLLSIHARDLWSWLSHTFEFISEQATASAGMMDRFSGDILSAGRLDVDEKRFRIAELEQRIADAGDPPKDQLIDHVLIWLNELAYIFNAIGDLTKAEQSIQRSLWIAEKFERQDVMASDYGNLGLIYQTKGDLDKAEQMYNKVLMIEENLGRPESMANAYGNLGVIYQTRGDLDKAEQMHRKSLEIAEKLVLLEIMASEYSNLGLIYRVRGDLDKSERMLKKSLEIAEKLGLQEGMAIAYSNLGLIYPARGDLDKTEQMLRKALEIAEKLGLQEGMAIAYGNLGLIHQTRGDLDKAEQMHRKSLEMDQRLGRLQGMANTYSNLGSLYRQRGDVAKARDYWVKAVELFKRIGMPQMVQKTQALLDELNEKDSKGKTQK